MLQSPEQDATSPSVQAVDGSQQLAQMEQILRKHWRLGQNMVLCWAPDPRGLLTVVVPHYFLGHFTAETVSKAVVSGDAGETSAGENETFLREVISGSRLKTHAEIFAIAKRLGVSTSFIKLDQPIGDDPEVLAAADAIISSYGLGYVNSRAVVLFDIAEFSLYTPFEQASQLNSLSYSMNSAYSKLQRQGVEVNFARTTTGDGYYVWNRDLGPFPDLDLLSFLLLVLIDNAVARRQASGNTVPVIRSAYHIGGHYELFQAEGVNPTVFSYIVGDVTIKLARMLASADAGQIIVGDFHAMLPDASGLQPAAAFIAAAIEELMDLSSLQIADKPLLDIQVTAGCVGAPDHKMLNIVDKHGLEQSVSNLQFEVQLGGERLTIGTPTPP